MIRSGDFDGEYITEVVVMKGTGRSVLQVLSGEVVTLYRTYDKDAAAKQFL